MTRNTLWLGSLLAAALGFSVARADDAPGVVEIPKNAMGEVVRHHPRGRMLATAAWKDLLAKAGVKDLADLSVQQAAQEELPLDVSVRSFVVAGGVVGELATFRSEATVTVLRKEMIALPLPLMGVGASEVTVDSKPAEVATLNGGFSVLLTGGTDHVVAWTSSVTPKPTEERGAGSLVLPLLSGAPAARLTFTIPGDLDLAADAPFTVAIAEGKTSLDAAIGGLDAVQLAWRPRRSEAHATPYVTVEDASRFLVERGFVQLDLTTVFSIFRAGADKLAIDLPVGFVVRDLEAIEESVVSREGPSNTIAVAGGPISPLWVQSNEQGANRLTVTLPSAFMGEVGVRLQAQLDAPQEGKLELVPARYPLAERSSGIVGVERADDVTVGVAGEKGLEQADLGTLAAGVALPGMLRVYRHGSPAGSIEVAYSPVKPNVALSIVGVEEIREKELRLAAYYSYRVQEGSVFELEAGLPASFRVESTTVRDGNMAVVTADVRTEERGDRTVLLVELPGGVRAGQLALIEVHAGRDVPTGVESERLSVPSLTGAPAKVTSGYVAFAVDPAFRLRGDTRGLAPFPVKALPGAGISVPDLALAYRIEDADYKGTLVLSKRETRIAVTTLVDYGFQERSVSTDAELRFEIEGAPVDSLEIVLPEGAGRMARIEGDDVVERAQIGKADAGQEHWRVGFRSPRSGTVVLSVHFDTPVADLGTEGSGKVDLPLPRISAAGVERERGTLAIYSSGSTEVVAREQNLHTVEVTEVPKPVRSGAGQDRPLNAYSYAGADWKLAVTATRHASAKVLDAIVERLAIQSSVGSDGTTREVATFVLKNLVHQFFYLQVPEGARLWSVVVDGVGAKPAQDGGVNVVPLVRPSSPDKAITVTVTYELKASGLGAFGSDALRSPVLLAEKAGAPIPILDTTWSVSLPDEFRYVGFGGNGRVEGEAPVDEPLVLQVWNGQQDLLIGLAVVAGLILLCLVSETLRSMVIALGSGIGGVLRGIFAWAFGHKVFVGVGVVVVLGVGIFVETKGNKGEWGFLPTASSNAAPSAPTSLGEPDEKQIYMPNFKPSDHNESNDDTDLSANGVREEVGGEGGVRGTNGNLDPNVRAQNKAGPVDKTPPEKPVAAPHQSPDLVKRLTPRPTTAEPPQPKPAEGDDGKDMAGFEDNFTTRDGAYNQRASALNTVDKRRKVAYKEMASALGAKGTRSLVLEMPLVGTTRTFTHDGGAAEVGFRYVRSDVWAGLLGVLAILGFGVGIVLPLRRGVSYLGMVVLLVCLLSLVPYVLWPSLTGAPSNAFLFGLLVAGPVLGLLALDRIKRAAPVKGAST